MSHQHRTKERKSVQEYRRICLLAISVICVISLVWIFVFKDDEPQGVLVDLCKKGECENTLKPKRTNAKESVHSKPQTTEKIMQEKQEDKKEKEEKDVEYTLPPMKDTTLYKSACMPVIQRKEEPVLEKAGNMFESLLLALTKPSNLKHAPALRSLYEQCVKSSADGNQSDLFESLVYAVLNFDEDDRLEDLLGLFAKYDIANPLSLSYEMHPKKGLRAGALVPLISQHQVQFSNDPNELFRDTVIRAHSLTFGIPKTKDELTRFGDFERLCTALYVGKPIHNSGTRFIDYVLHGNAIQEELLVGAAQIEEFSTMLKGRGFDLKRYFAAANVPWPREFLWVHSPNTMFDFVDLAHFTPHSAWRDYLFVILHTLREPEMARTVSEKQHYVYNTHYSGRWALPWDVPSQYEFVTSEDHCMGLVEAYLPHATNVAIEKAIPMAKKTADRVRMIFEEARSAVLQFIREDRYKLFELIPAQVFKKLEKTQLILFDEVDEVRESIVDPNLPKIARKQHYLDTILELRRRTLQKAATLRWNPRLPDARLLYDQMATPENAFFVQQLNSVVFNLGLLHAFATEEISELQVKFLLAHELAHALDATGLFYDEMGGLTLELVSNEQVVLSRARWDSELVNHYKRTSFVHKVENDLKRTKHENFADAVATLSLVRAYQHDGKRVFEMLHQVAELFCEPLALERQEDVRHTFTSTHSLASVRADALWSLAQKEFKGTPPQERY